MNTCVEIDTYIENHPVYTEGQNVFAERVLLEDLRHVVRIPTRSWGHEAEEWAENFIHAFPEFVYRTNGIYDYLYVGIQTQEDHFVRTKKVFDSWPDWKKRIRPINTERVGNK